MEQSHFENMWCFNCDHEWTTDDYYNCNACPNCNTIPIRIYRTSSTAFAYAHIAKHPEQYHPRITGENCVDYCDWPRCQEPDCIRKNKTDESEKSI